MKIFELTQTPVKPAPTPNFASKGYNVNYTAPTAKPAATATKPTPAAPAATPAPATDFTNKGYNMRYNVPGQATPAANSYTYGGRQGYKIAQPQAATPAQPEPAKQPEPASQPTAAQAPAAKTQPAAPAKSGGFLDRLKNVAGGIASVAKQDTNQAFGTNLGGAEETASVSPAEAKRIASQLTQQLAPKEGGDAAKLFKQDVQYQMQQNKVGFPSQLDPGTVAELKNNLKSIVWSRMLKGSKGSNLDKLVASRPELAQNVQAINSVIDQITTFDPKKPAAQASSEWAQLGKQVDALRNSEHFDNPEQGQLGHAAQNSQANVDNFLRILKSNGIDPNKLQRSDPSDRRVLDWIKAKKAEMAQQGQA